MKPIVIGIMQQERIRERILAIARGSYKPKPNEPKVWSTSMKSLAEVLSDENRALAYHLENETGIHISFSRDDGAQVQQPVAHAQDHVQLWHRGAQARAESNTAGGQGDRVSHRRSVSIEMD